MSEMFRKKQRYEASVVVGQRGTTDPYLNEDLPRAPENPLDKHTLGKIIGKVAIKKSIHGPNAENLRIDTPDNLPDASPSRRAIKSNLRNAKRISRHEVKQANARHAERVFSAGSGMGEKAKLKTYIQKKMLTRELKESYTTGQISSKEFIDKSMVIKKTRIERPVRAVRNINRAERLNGLYIQAAASQPITDRVRRFKKRHYEKKLGNLK
jgi:hypothetical protein